jgi:hypothetical protein
MAGCGAVPGVDLGPVVAQQPAVPVNSQEEAGRVEPGFGHARVKVRPGEAALFGVVREGGAVGRQPGVLILARHKGADGHAGRKDGVGKVRRRRRHPHFP